MTDHPLLNSVSAAAVLSLGLFATTASAHFIGVAGNNSIDGSLCVGFDCAAEEAFSFDTIRLKENNLRIKFMDTSNAAAFPNNDWQIRANASANGGLNAFFIDDMGTANTTGQTPESTPFTIEANAGTNAFYIDDAERIGLGTSNPVVELHIVDGDTPTVRLEQDTSSGFDPHTWDVAGNETNFFVRDVTSGSLLPFRIRPGAPSSSLMVDAVGNIGLGTASPDGPLHIRDDSVYITLGDANDNDKWFITHQAGNDGNFELTSELNAAVANVALFLEPDGDMTIDGVLTENSDKNAKMAIEPVDTDAILEKVANLPVSKWTYKDDVQGARHIGPMAQDFYALFGLGATETGISTLDTSGVALAAIQALSRQVDELTRLTQEQQRIIDTLR